MKILKYTLFAFVFGIMSFAWGQSNYLIPQSVVNALLADYTQEEIERIQADLVNIRTLMFRGKVPSAQPIYIAKAGAPGAGKSTILEKELEENPLYLQENPVYIDPDQRGLKLMINTYWQDLTLAKVSNATPYEEYLKAAYVKWRAASNYIADTLLNEAFSKSYSIAHGTTSTGQFIEQLYCALKQSSYKIHLNICDASLKNRLAAVHHRTHVQNFYQTTPEDFEQKAQLWIQKMPLYLKYADCVTLWDANQVFNFAKTEAPRLFDWAFSAGMQADTCLSKDA